jgi:hypothetical protein
MTYPNLAKIATADLVEHIGGGNFRAAYINWSRTLQLLRDHAPGWLPELVEHHEGGILHPAPVGAFLLIRFRHQDGSVTPAVPQAVMDSRNAAVPRDKITARDVTDTHRRGVCMAAALTFGLAYELWAKMPLESGYEASQEQQGIGKVTPTDGVWEAQSPEQQARLEEIAGVIREHMSEGDAAGAHEYIHRLGLDTDAKAALWTRLDSKIRSALKRAHNEAKGG